MTRTQASALTRERRWLIAMMTAASLLSGGAAQAIDLRRGEALPRLELPTTNGEHVDTDALRGRVVLLLFGETNHERTRLARIHLDAALDDPRLAGVDVQPILVLTKRSVPDDLGRRPGDGAHRLFVVHDTHRVAFGVYEVVAIPSVVVADPAGLVVHAAAGLATDRFGDVVLDALLLAAGRIGADRLDATIEGTDPPDSMEAELRAHRLARVARRLVQAQIHAMAEEQYLEAIDLAPQLLELRIELGHVLVAQRRLSEAQHHFELALKAEPQSHDAACGVALVLALGGEPGGLAQSLAIIDTLLERYPQSPRAHYVRGLVQQAQGDSVEAAVSFRRATELLLERLGPTAAPEEDVPSPAAPEDKGP